MVQFGNMDATVSIGLYTSFACSDCKEFHHALFGLLVDDYVRQGKVLLRIREFFQANNKAAFDAAMIGIAAARLGKYREVADALFASQGIWTANGKPWDSVAGVFNNQFEAGQALVNDPELISQITADLKDASAAGVAGTPILYTTARSKTTPFIGIPEAGMFRRYLDGLADN